ncbi:inositol-trisphosphate 3-kinase homolog isoform X1 [Eupeodes corollae]|uniref:inositol-trisphosphate 3-kinase homolog isoform X1 n=1 Tax=Eupeodes corollae TaxID=290404 RepID=UPI00249147A0|nr:inositol-trisphosphate 3-kinase homolog isoform X1 [Eupeodes corollae]
MTSTILQSSAQAASTMAWSNEKLRLSCVDNIGLRQLWKLIVLNSSNNNNTSTNNNSTNNIINNNNNNNQNSKNKNSEINSENLAEFLTNRDILPPSEMSLLKFLAINALELSAPASPVLLQQQHQQHTAAVAAAACKPKGWMQLSGHPESIVPTTTGIVRKRVISPTDHEANAYEFITNDPSASKLVPKYYGVAEYNGDAYIELQDLLTGFKDPNVMDIKMGCRTFLESEVTNKTLRPDLYQKMIALDKDAPTAEEHELQAITKLRYMLFREAMSSSHTKGFRIEALRRRGASPIKDLKTVRNTDQIEETILQFLNSNKTITKELIKRLRTMRTLMEKSEFFRHHEIVGSSIFIVYDDEKVGAWLIDFAKSRRLPADVQVNHRQEWIPGNREEGLIKGMDELIRVFEGVYEIQTGKRLTK